jgi:cell wall-associated NlpC family hydrolase
MRLIIIIPSAGLALAPLLYLAAGAGAPSQEPSGAEKDGYQSPYTVHFSFTEDELIGDLRGERGDPRLQSRFGHGDWYSRQVRERYGAWGPPARHYPAPAGLAERSPGWKRQRVIAIGLRFQGYTYQHHHIPDWDPPPDWPWKEVGVGHNARGVDCSNFTAFVYNLGFGIKPSSAIKEQASTLDINGPGAGQRLRAQTVPLPESYDELGKVLRTGDLLFIRSRQGEISHVVLWVGDIGRSPDGTPLILDSHGTGIRDANGQSIPCGIHLRPLRRNSWYFHSASHALRLFPQD